MQIGATFRSINSCFRGLINPVQLINFSSSIKIRLGYQIITTEYLSFK